MGRRLFNLLAGASPLTWLLAVSLVVCLAGRSLAVWSERRTRAAQEAERLNLRLRIEADQKSLEGLLEASIRNLRDSRQHQAADPERVGALRANLRRSEDLLGQSIVIKAERDKLQATLDVLALSPPPSPYAAVCRSAAWLSGVLAGILALAWVSRRCTMLERMGAGRCVQCGYDLRASKERCPECGTAIPAPATSGGRMP